MTFLFSVTKEHVDLAQAEIEELFGIVLKPLANNLFLVEDVSLQQAYRLSYTKAIYNVLIVSSTFDPKQCAQHVKNSYKLGLIDTSGTAPPLQKIADTIFDELTQPKVSIANPSHYYTLFWFENNTLFTEKLFVNEDKPLERDAILPCHKPCSMDPRIAKAMINLGSKHSFYDPFCGTGRLLIEGKRLGLIVSGSDLSDDMLRCAKENVRSCAFDIPLEQKNAQTISGTHEVIVTDLPYGKNAPHQKDLETLYTNFFIKSQHCTKRLVIACESTFPIENLLTSTAWVVKRTFIFYKHKSLSRKILLLTLSNHQ